MTRLYEDSFIGWPSCTVRMMCIVCARIESARNLYSNGCRGNRHEQQTYLIIIRDDINHRPSGIKGLKRHIRRDPRDITLQTE